MGKLDIREATPELSEALAAAVFVDMEDAAVILLVRAKTLSGVSDRQVIEWLAGRIAHLDAVMRRFQAKPAAQPDRKRTRPKSP